MVARLLAALLCLGLLSAATPLDHAGRIASLIDRAKLATLGERAANPRIQKTVYWPWHEQRGSSLPWCWTVLWRRQATRASPPHSHATPCSATWTLPTSWAA